MQSSLHVLHLQPFASLTHQSRVALAPSLDVWRANGIREGEGAGDPTQPDSWSLMSGSFAHVHTLPLPSCGQPSWPAGARRATPTTIHCVEHQQLCGWGCCLQNWAAAGLLQRAGLFVWLFSNHDCRLVDNDVPHLLRRATFSCAEPGSQITCMQRFGRRNARRQNGS